MANVVPASGGSIRSVAALVAATLVGAGLVAVAMSGPTQEATGSTPRCSPRVVIVDLSAADRGPQLSNLALQIIEAAAISAVVCGGNLSAYGVSGGGEVSTIVTSDDLARFTPIGPNAQVRATRFGAGQRTALDRLITDRLVAAYRTGDPRVTSLAAMYEVAAQQSTSSTDDVFVTTGVNSDQVVNLNQPLRVGEGSQLAKKVRVAHISARQVVEVGIAQVDSSIPPPSAQWSQEVLSFNEALCKASGVASCHLYDIASVSQVLGS
jgi:hypothetical protein